MSGLVTFRLGERDYATPLSAVCEVVRLERLTDLPGMTPPLAGVLDLRGIALPVLDLRHAGAVRGDVLVVEGDSYGVAVDAVQAVVTEGELPPGGSPGAELPSYVVAVLRGPDGPVFLVDLARMVDSVRGAA